MATPLETEATQESLTHIHDNLKDCIESFAIASALGHPTPVYKGAKVYKVVMSNSQVKSRNVEPLLHATPAGAWRAALNRYLHSVPGWLKNNADEELKARILSLLDTDPEEAFTLYIQNSVWMQDLGWSYTLTAVEIAE